MKQKDSRNWLSGDERQGSLRDGNYTKWAMSLFPFTALISFLDTEHRGKTESELREIAELRVQGNRCS